MVTRVAVIGAGGMGSWFARFFKSRGDSVIVSDRDRRKARSLASRIRARCASSNAQAARESDIVIIATPVNVVSDVIKEIVPILRRNTLLCDVCAVKSAVIPALRSAERRGIRVASIHPMFGPLASGLRDKVIVVACIGKDRRGIDMVKRVFQGARIFLADPDAHDKQTALTLALPHFLNMAFASAISRKRKLAEVRKFAGRTFHLQMLLAETVATEPDTTADIQITNKQFAIILRELQRDIQSLARLIYRRDRPKLIARYRRIKELLSTDPEFSVARKTFEKICEVSSTISKG